MRAEIAKDAGALLGFTEIHPQLAARRVDQPRLDALAKAAADLAGALAVKTASKGARKTATQAEQDAVKEQGAQWAASYRLFAALGQQDERVRSLLKEAAK